MTTTTITKVHTTESIKTLLSTSLPAIERAILVIYERQTLDEKATESTSHNNGVGFSAVDAEILSSFAAQIQRKQGRGVALGACLSEKQMVIAKKRMLVYARQLAEVANEKAGLSQEEVKALLRAAKVAEKAEAKGVEVATVEAPKVKAEASLSYWLKTPSKAWKALTYADAQNWFAAMALEVTRRASKVNVGTLAEMQDGNFWMNYAREILQVMESDIAPESTEWNVKVLRNNLKGLNFTDAQIEEQVQKTLKKVEAEKAKTEVKAEAPSIANDDFKSAKAKITDWLMKS